MNNKYESVDQYIASFPEDVQQILQEIRKVIIETAPEAVESISYGMPAYKLNGKALVYFAAFKNHIGLYPLPSGIEQFKSDLAKCKHAKGSVQFPLSEPIPIELVKKIVEFRAKEK